MTCILQCLSGMPALALADPLLLSSWRCQAGEAPLQHPQAPALRAVLMGTHLAASRCWEPARRLPCLRLPSFGQQGHNTPRFAQAFSTALAGHVMAAEGNAAAVLASRGAARQPQPSRPGWVLPGLVGGHVSGHNSAPRPLMEAWEAAMESLRPGGSD